MSRFKTVSISSIVKYANIQLANPNLSYDYKEGVIAMLERSLFAVDAYEGFIFLDNDDCKIGTPGYYNRKYFIN